jgi:hypothetical protein
MEQLQHIPNQYYTTAPFMNPYQQAVPLPHDMQLVPKQAVFVQNHPAFYAQPGAQFQQYAPQLYTTAMPSYSYGMPLNPSPHLQPHISPPLLPVSAPLLDSSSVDSNPSSQDNIKQHLNRRLKLKVFQKEQLEAWRNESEPAEPQPHAVQASRNEVKGRIQKRIKVKMMISKEKESETGEEEQQEEEVLAHKVPISRNPEPLQQPLLQQRRMSIPPYQTNSFMQPMPASYGPGMLHPATSPSTVYVNATSPESPVQFLMPMYSLPTGYMPMPQTMPYASHEMQLPYRAQGSPSLRPQPRTQLKPRIAMKPPTAAQPKSVLAQKPAPPQPITSTPIIKSSPATKPTQATPPSTLNLQASPDQDVPKSSDSVPLTQNANEAEENNNETTRGLHIRTTTSTERKKSLSAHPVLQSSYFPEEEVQPQPLSASSEGRKMKLKRPAAINTTLTPMPQKPEKATFTQVAVIPQPVPQPPPSHSQPLMSPFDVGTAMTPFTKFANSVFTVPTSSTNPQTAATPVNYIALSPSALTSPIGFSAFSAMTPFFSFPMGLPSAAPRPAGSSSGSPVKDVSEQMEKEKDKEKEGTQDVLEKESEKLAKNNGAEEANEQSKEDLKNHG